MDGFAAGVVESTGMGFLGGGAALELAEQRAKQPSSNTII
jgi:hypothetical protein